MGAAPSRPPAVQRRHATLALEMIGEDRRQQLRQDRRTGRHSSIRQILDAPLRPFVARICGLTPGGELVREPLRGMRSYRDANSSGSRGIYEHYTLEEGSVYEVLALLSWSRRDHYYATVRAGAVVRLTEAEVAQWGW